MMPLVWRNRDSPSILVVVVALSLRKTQFGPHDQNDRASTYVELLLNDHALPCNIKVAQAKVSNLSHRQSTVFGFLVNLRIAELKV